MLLVWILFHFSQDKLVSDLMMLSASFLAGSPLALWLGR
jgi:hypothetical protein